MLTRVTASIIRPADTRYRCCASLVRRRNLRNVYAAIWMLVLGFVLLGCEEAVNPQDKPQTPEPPATGSLDVRSNPLGANIFLDGRDTGEITPHTFNDMAPGTYAIRVALGQREAVDTAEVSAGQTTVVNLTLPPRILSGVSIADVNIPEGDSGTTSAVFVVTLSAPSGQQVTVDYATSNGTAVAGSDYTATSGTLTFPAGNTRQTILVAVRGDTTDEADETFAVALRNPSAQARLVDATATGTIIDDDEAPALSIAAASVTEGNTGTTRMVFAVTLSAASKQQVTVGYATSNGTAVAGSDYTATSGTLTFPAGNTRQTILVAVRGDTTDEADETFTVALRNPSAQARLVDATATGTIIDDDEAPALSIAAASVTEGNTGTARMSFSVTLNPASGQQVTVDYATSNGTAVAGSDYTATSGTLTFAAGNTRQTIAVFVQGDTTPEPDETFALTLRHPSRATLMEPVATGTITNDDDPFDLAVTEFVVLADAIVRPGSSIRLDTKILNNGPSRSPATTVRYYRSLDPIITRSDTEVGESAISTLISGETVDLQSSLTLSTSPGRYYYGACVESDAGGTDGSNDCSGEDESILADWDHNSRASARTLTLPQRSIEDGSWTYVTWTLPGYLKTGDRDHFEFVFHPTMGRGQLTVETQGTTDTRGVIQYADGSPYPGGADDNAGRGSNFRIVTSSDIIGVYYIVVTGSDDQQEGSYALRVRFDKFDYSDFPDGAHFATSNSSYFGWLSGSEISGNSLRVPSLGDYFQVHVSGCRTLSAYTTGNPQFGGLGIPDTAGWLYDDAATLIARDSNSGHGNHFHIRRVISRGIYYIKVGGYSSYPVYYKKGPYELHVSLTAGDC